MRAGNEGMQKSTQSGLAQDWVKSGGCLGQVWVSVLCAQLYNTRPSGDLCERVLKIEKTKGNQISLPFAVCPCFSVFGAKNGPANMFTKSEPSSAQVWSKSGGCLTQVWVSVPCALPFVSYSGEDSSRTARKNEKTKGEPIGSLIPV